MALLNVNQASNKLGINTCTLWRWRKAGKFPDPVKKVGRQYFWEEDTVVPPERSKAYTVEVELPNPNSTHVILQGKTGSRTFNIIVTETTK